MLCPYLTTPPCLPHSLPPYPSPHSPECSASRARTCSGEAVPVTGKIDIVGAGDSATAGLVSALCSGANPAEAAVIANLVASITIQQLGTTGTASPEQVRARLAEHTGLWGEA